MISNSLPYNRRTNGHGKVESNYYATMRAFPYSYNFMLTLRRTKKEYARKTLVTPILGGVPLENSPAHCINHTVTITSGKFRGYTATKKCFGKEPIELR